MNETKRPAPPVKVGDRVEVTVEELAFGGNGVGRLDGYTLFVRGGLPGQRVVVRVLKRKGGWAETRIEEVLARSPDEIDPVCRHFGSCGGCLWQNLAYERQLEAKARQVRDCLVRIGGIDEPPMEPPLAAPSHYGYRNKMEFSFGDNVWRDRRSGPEEPGGGGTAMPAAGPPPAGPVADPPRRTAEFGLGLHARGRFDKVLVQEECHIAPAWMAEVTRDVHRLARETGFPAYAVRSHGGFFRFLVLREGRHTGERMLNLITYPAAAGSGEERAVTALLEEVHRRHPEVTSLLHGTTASRANVAYCESFRAVAGPDVIHERLLGDRFTIGPNTFFQTNSEQAERLFRLALTMAGPPVDLAWDLYCGVGALTLPLARQAGRVIGVELIEASVEAARRNAAANGRDNVEFLALDMKRAITPEGIVDGGGRRLAGRPQLVLVDPPRDGMHGDVVAGLVALAPERLVYVSCNPSTLARDAALLVAGGFRMERAVPVDMFPQTAHVEMVALFVRAGTG